MAASVNLPHIEGDLATFGVALGRLIPLIELADLVIEIGAVIVLLLGWQFLVADVVGGFMLIGLMALGFVYVVPDSVVERARDNVLEEGEPTAQDPVGGMEVNPEETDYTTEVDGQTYYFCSRSCMESFDPEEANTTIREQATSLSGWGGAGRQAVEGVGDGLGRDRDRIRLRRSHRGLHPPQRVDIGLLGTGPRDTWVENFHVPTTDPFSHRWNEKRLRRYLFSYVSA